MTETAGQVRIEPGRKRVRAYLDGELVADTRHAVPGLGVALLPDLLPSRPADVRAALLPSGETEHSPSRGEAEVYHVTRCPGPPRSGPRCATPTRRSRTLRGLVRLDWDAMSEWFEEDEPVYTHPRDPYSRVDILASSRHVRVEVDGVTVADSRQPRILFETGLPPRYYIPLTDVRMDLLRPSDTRLALPVQGHGQLLVGGRRRSGVHTDIVWIYRTPLPESQKIAGLACFYDEKVDVYLDGELQPRPTTHFS